MLSLCGCMDFSQLQHTGATLVARASHCSGFCCGAWALGCACFNSWACQAQEQRLSRCGVRASLLQDTWDLPRPGIEPVPPALAGGFFTTEPPGKPQEMFSNTWPQMFLCLIVGCRKLKTFMLILYSWVHLTCGRKLSDLTTSASLKDSRDFEFSPLLLSLFPSYV